MELGEPRTSLGDVIGGGNNDPVVGPPGPQGPPGQDGSIGDFPNTLPSTPVLESFVYGFSNIELSWTFENKVYYSYELYGSKTKDFKPNTFDLIFEGQASTYMFQAKPNETWYFRVCAINTHGERTNFSNQVTVTTTKIEDLSNYVENMAISEALIGTLSLDRGWIGTLKGNYIDARQLSVTDGNGKRTLDIDSFGNVNLDPTVIKVGFNGINDSILIDPNKMQFKDSAGNQSLSFMRGSLYAYEPNSSVFMGAGLIPRWNQGLYNAGFGVLAGANSYYYSIARANSWEADTQANPGAIDEYFIINYRDRGSDLSQKQGCHTYYKLYTSGGINGMGYDIENFTNIKCLDLYAGTIKDTNGSTILTTNGSSIASNKNWNFNYFTLSNAHLSNASLNTNQDCSVGSISTYTYKGSNGTTLFTSASTLFTSASTCSNRVGWAWNNNNLLDPVIIGGSYGYSITPNADTYSNVKTYNDNINLDGVLDKINIYPTRTTYRASSERSLEIDVTELRESENADMFIKTHNTVNSETGESEIVENIDMKSMLHLALLEIKKH